MIAFKQKLLTKIQVLKSLVFNCDGIYLTQGPGQKIWQQICDIENEIYDYVEKELLAREAAAKSPKIANWLTSGRFGEETAEGKG